MSFKTVFFCLFAIAGSSLTMAQTVNHVDGYVSVNQSALQGTWNVRYNDNDSGSIQVAGDIGKAVRFAGRDRDNHNFVCNVSTSSEWYNYAVRIRKNFADGSYILILDNNHDGECDYLQHEWHLKYMH